MEEHAQSRRIVAEGLGTALLLAAVVGSGIMAERLSGGSVGLALLANTVATAAALIALILTFGPISGAHFNPAVTLTLAFRGDHRWSDTPAYIAAQFSGAIAGVWIAHAMFAEPVWQLSRKPREGLAQSLSEFVATFGLIAVIWSCSLKRRHSVPYAVAAYIAAAYWFTASTSFANPAVTVARALTDSFAGIRLADAPGFIAAELLGATVAAGLFSWLMPVRNPRALEPEAPLSERP